MHFSEWCFKCMGQFEKRQRYIVLLANTHDPNQQLLSFKFIGRLS
jgi:hypothetical protein